MKKVELDEIDIEILNKTEEGRAYLEYNDKIGGERFGLCIGMPDFHIEERFGGEAGLYRECIKRGVTWQELLGTDGRYDELED